MPKATPKSKPCKFSECGKMFLQFTSTQKVCGGSIKCALGYAKEKEKEKNKKAYKVETRRMKMALNAGSYRYQIKKAQPAFNSFIRERDRGLNCISCDRTEAEVMLTDGWKTGGAWDCGHFLTIGGFPELRFSEINAHRQCKSCNGGSAKYARKKRTVGEDYEKRLPARIGQANVDWLLGPHDAKNYTAADLIEITKLYREKKKQLQQARPADDFNQREPLQLR